MYDITVSHPSGARDSSASTRRGAGGEPPNRAEGDDLLACVIITNWMLATGRTLPAGVAPQSLSEDELISFWADDYTANENDAISGPDPACAPAADPDTAG